MIRKTPFVLDVGQNEIKLPPEVTVDNLTEVELVGLRDRTFKLVRMRLADFNAMLGENKEERVAKSHMRGMPVYWTVRHSTVVLWPTPAHEWGGNFIDTVREPPAPAPLVA